MAKPPLGRGLNALLGEEKAPQAEPAPPPSPPAPPSPAGSGEDRPPARVPAASIRPCPFQPRREFEQGALEELADSIRVQGVIQPLVVRPAENGYELIAGERRWRAARMAGLEQVPVVIRQAGEQEAMELALVENLQRENLNPLEEALGLRQLIQDYGLTQEEVGRKVGKNRATVANSLRLLQLAPPVQSLLRKGRISAGHAKALLRLKDPKVQEELALRVDRTGLSVRDAEKWIAQREARRAPAPPEPAPRDPHIDRLEEKVRDRVGSRVQIRYREGKGILSLHFFSEEDLQRIMGLLGVRPD